MTGIALKAKISPKWTPFYIPYLLGEGAADYGYNITDIVAITTCTYLEINVFNQDMIDPGETWVGLQDT